MSGISHQLASVKADGSRLPIFPSDVQGRFITGRRFVFWALIGFYVLAPVLHLGKHALVHLDVDARRFYLFGQTFNAQDAWLMVLLLASGVFSLLLVTTWRGRVWCGWACPQTVFVEAIFRPIERLLEGPRERRMRALNEPLTFGRAARKVLKHLGYLIAALGLAHVAVALFIPREELGGMIADGPLAHPVAFVWTMAITGLAYFDFGWFREQFCVVLCPYGRLQSVMHDRDSVIVGYDLKRGEPRGQLKKAGFGDCIDCKKCVTACPTAIDIRDGLQMECVACAQCADACDRVMDKIGKPRGLIRYASINELDGKKRRVIRPRLLVYAALLTVFAGAFATAIALRKPFEANVLRLPGPPYVLDEGRIRNGLFVHLVNKSPERRTYWVKAEGPDGAEVKVEPSQVELGSLESTQVSVVAWLPRANWQKGLHVEVHVEQDDGTHREQDVPFVGPLLPH